MSQNRLKDGEYLRLTVPFMLSTMTQPLMGAVNTAVMGQMADPKYVIAIGGCTISGGTEYFEGMVKLDATVSGGADVTLSDYSSNGGGNQPGGGGGGPGGGNGPGGR